MIPSDLAQADSRERVLSHVNAAYGGADVLVNNAGLGWYGFGTDMPWEIATEMLQVNIAAVVHFTLMFLRGMRERNRGHIINVGSISGGLPSQGVALYGATKSFLDNFTTSLYRELRGSRVCVSVVRAGPVITEFCQRAAGRTGGSPVPTERIGVTPEKIAESIWGLLQRPRRVIYIPRWLVVTPWIETSFGWLIDRIGPLLLRRQATINN